MKTSCLMYDDIGASTIPDLPVPTEDEEEEVKPTNAWNHAIDTVF